MFKDHIKGLGDRVDIESVKLSFCCLHLRCMVETKPPGWRDRYRVNHYQAKSNSETKKGELGKAPLSGFIFRLIKNWACFLL